MKRFFYVGEIRSFFADVDGDGVEMILVTKIDQIITTCSDEDYDATHDRLISEDKEFAVYPDSPYIVAIDPAALADFFGGAA